MTKENRDWLTGPGRICCQLVRFDNRWVVVLGLVDRVEISHIRIGPAGNGRISSRGSGSSPSHEHDRLTLSSQSFSISVKSSSLALRFASEAAPNSGKTQEQSSVNSPTRARSITSMPVFTMRASDTPIRVHVHGNGQT